MSQVLVSEPAAHPERVSRRAAPLRRSLRLALPAFGFFAIALVTRFILQETQSRLQIMAFAAAAALVEQVRASAGGRSFSSGRWVLNAAAAAVGVLLTKHVVEPGSITDFVLHVLDRAGITAPAWLDPNT